MKYFKQIILAFTLFFSIACTCQDVMGDMIVPQEEEGINGNLLEITQNAGTLSTAYDIKILCGLSSESDVTNLTYDAVTFDLSCEIIADYDLKSNAFYTNTTLLTFKDYGRCKNFLSQPFYNCTSVTDVYAESVETTGNRCFQGATSLVTANLPSLTTIPNPAITFVYLCSNLTTLYIPSCTVIGTTVSGSENAFLAASGILTITVDASLETINGGGREGDIAYAEDTKGATIVYE